MIEISEKKWFLKLLWVWNPKEIEQKSGYDFIRIVSLENVAPPYGFKKYNRLTITIDLTKPLDEIFSEFAKRCRNSITKAERIGLYVEHSESPDDYSRFYKAYRKLCSSEALIPHSLGYCKQGDLFVTMNDKDMVSAAIIVKDNKYAALHMLVSMEPTPGRNNLLIYEIIKYLKSNSIETFDLGGIPVDAKKSEKTGVYFFKKSFGGKETPVFHYIKVSKRHIFLQVAEIAKRKRLLPDFIF